MKDFFSEKWENFLQWMLEIWWLFWNKKKLGWAISLLDQWGVVSVRRYSYHYWDKDVFSKFNIETVIIEAREVGKRACFEEVYLNEHKTLAHNIWITPSYRSDILYIVVVQKDGNFCKIFVFLPPKGEKNFNGILKEAVENP